MFIQNGAIPRSQPPRVFSPLLYRVSQLIQHPVLITFREVCLIALVIYALYEAYFAIGMGWYLLAVVNAGLLCNRRTFVGCNWHMFWQILGVVAGWLGLVLPWAVVCVVVVFVGENVIGLR